MDRVYVMELVRSFQCGVLSRRDFVARASTALGSLTAANLLAAACVPVTPPPPPIVASPTAEAAPVDAGGAIIEYGNVEGQPLTGYLARPASDQPAPAVVVIQEWWGLNEHIKDVTRRFAREGFVALAPDLYHGVVVTEPNEARKLVMELDMEAAIAEIRRAVAFLLEQPYVAGPRAGIVGFCMGGRLVLMTARVEDKLGAAVPFYGSPLKPEEATEVKAPVLGLYGANDQGIPVDAVRAMEEALTQAGIENEFHIYEGAGHAFFNDTGASYNPEAAQDAWTRTLDWLRRHLSQG